MFKAGFIIVLMGIFANAGFGLAGSGTEADPWRIQSLADFNDFAADANYWEDYTRLETDVNLVGLTYATAVIAPDTDNSNYGFDGVGFTGVFDGNDCKIIYLTIDDGGAGNDYLGLFGYIDGGEIRNLGLEDCLVSGDGYIGGLLGWSSSSGIVSHCYSTGDISGSWDVGGLVGAGSASFLSCHSTCDVLGENVVGGLVGGTGYGRISFTAGGPITDCYSAGDVNGIDLVGGLVGSNGGGSVSGCYSTGDVNGDWKVGGLTGSNRDASVSDCYSIGDVTGTFDVGGLVGENFDGFVSRCWSSGRVLGEGDIYSDTQIGGLVGENSGGTISDCNSGSNVSGDQYVGGLVGQSTGNLLGCYSTGNVSGGGYTGGLVGQNGGGSILNCYSACKTSGSSVVGGLAGENGGGQISTSYSIGETSGGSCIGGIVGWNYGSISVCYSGCDVNGTGDDVGGLVGSNIDMRLWPTEGIVWNCLWDVEVQTHGVSKSIGDDAGIIIDVVGAGTVQMETQETFTSSGWDFLGESANGTSETWRMPVEAGYPVLSISYSGIPFALAGSGTVDDPYLVGDANDLGMVRWYPEDSCFKVTCDIDLSGITWPDAVVPRFEGTFDGDGHKVVNLRISGNVRRLGLFGYVGNDGQVRSLGLEGGHVNGAEAIFVGALVGENEGGSVSNCYSGSDVTGLEYVGGLVGRNYGGSVLSCYSTGDVNGVWDVGGLVGRNDTSSSVSNCYSAADVDGVDDVGGLVGNNYQGSVANCFWDTDIQTHGVTRSIGNGFNGTVTNVAGLPTSDMQTKSSFTSAGWDFVGVWDLVCEGMNYPRLVWEIPVGDLGCPHGVDSRDYSFFADRWMDSDCGGSGDCDGADFDFSGTVDGGDLQIFLDHWLDGCLIGR